MHGVVKRFVMAAPLVVSLLLPAAAAPGQSAAPADETAGNAAASVAAASEELISLDLPENVELKVLIEYVSQRLNLNILYEDQVAAQRITLRAPVQIPKSSLLNLLEGVLQMKGLALVDAEQPGWKRIAAATNLNAIARPTTQLAPTDRGTAVVTQIFALHSVDTQKAEQVIRPFLTQPGGNSIALPEQRLLIVTDYAANLQRVEQLLRMVDQARRDVAMEFVPAQSQDAGQLAQQLSQLLIARLKAQGDSAASGPGLEITSDGRTNQVILIGSRSRVDEAMESLKALDKPLETTTRIYQLKAAAPERVDRLAREMLGPGLAKAYRSVADREGNMLVVTAPAQVHTQIQSLMQDLDVPVAEEQSAVRFYKLMNSTAADVLQTIQAIEGQQSLASVNIEGSRPSGMAGAATQPVGPNRPPPPPGQFPPPPPAYTGTQAAPAPEAGAPAPAVTSFRTAKATVTADVNTNTIIVAAEPAVQRVYEQMIRMLDKRRPQVLVECTLVTIDTSNSFSLGVEIAARGSADSTDFITFSSFGLSTVNRDTGQLALNPGAGFNGTIINADVGDLVIRALATHSRSKVLAAPKILVNDNATGTLESVAEFPFASLNASDTVATTSFAGYASAGTTITLTPHISEGDHLQLEYTVALNSFTGTPSAGLPPPRQTDSVSSKITVPHGSTVVVGGLNRSNYSKAVTAVPLLGQIPVLEYLFSSRQVRQENATLFVFMRPIILRDDQFQDLKGLSQQDIADAGLSGDWPLSEPLCIR